MEKEEEPPKEDYRGLLIRVELMISDQKNKNSNCSSCFFLYRYSVLHLASLYTFPRLSLCSGPTGPQALCSPCLCDHLFHIPHTSELGSLRCHVSENLYVETNKRYRECKTLYPSRKCRYLPKLMLRNCSVGHSV